MIYRVQAALLAEGPLQAAYVEVKDGRFTRILTHYEGPYVDRSACLMAPGYVDTHIHGYGGRDVMEGEPEALFAISRGIIQNGVTSFLPTTLTASVEELDRVCQMIGRHYHQCTGAKVRGIFLEGPFFTEKHKGAQDPRYFRDPDIALLKRWKTLSKGLVNKIALAPERAGSGAFIRQARELGVYVALGHSDATYEEADRAVQAGANLFVHTYNAMSGLHHRNPGMVGACLTEKDAVCELICDGHHVHPKAAELVVQARGYDHVALITDCMMAGGMPDGAYHLGDFDVCVQNGTARLVNGGALAGSILKMNEAVENVVKWGISEVWEAVQMASLIPARSVGLDGVCGKLQPGYEADFNLLREDLTLVETYRNGQRMECH